MCKHGSNRMVLFMGVMAMMMTMFFVGIQGAPAAPQEGVVKAASVKVGEVPSAEMRSAAVRFLETNGMFPSGSVKAKRVEPVKMAPAEWAVEGEQLYYHLQVEVRDGNTVLGDPWFTIFVNRSGIPQDYAAERLFDKRK